MAPIGPSGARVTLQSQRMTYSDIRTAAQYYALSPKTLRKLAQRGDVPAVKVGSRWRFLLPALGGAA